MTKITRLCRIETGVLAGTEIEFFMSFVGAKYPHRKTKDLYFPPTKVVKTWHCCQEGCKTPDFEGGFEALIDHLMLHKGKLLKSWSKKQQLKSPIPAVRIPPNEWLSLPKDGANEDRRFCVSLYIDRVKVWLRKQGIEILEA